VKYLVLFGRILFSLIFVFSGLNHFSSDVIKFAVAEGVPLARIAVPLSGVMAILGGLSVALGYKARWGASLLVLFLVPVTAMMHRFWATTDPIAAQLELAMFMKNVSILGGALLIAYFGAGPLSLDAAGEARSRHSVLNQGRERAIA